MMYKEKSFVVCILAVLFLTMTVLAEEAGVKNLLTNPGFEEGWNGWEMAKGGVRWHTVMLDDDEANTGKCSVKIGNWPGPYGGYWVNSEYISIDPSKSYKFSFFSKTTPGIKGKIYGRINCYDKTDKRLEPYIYLYVGPHLKWREASMVIEPSSFPEGTAKVKVFLTVSDGPGKKEYARFDDICLKEISDEEIRVEQKKASMEFEVYLKQDLLRELLRRYSQFHSCADTYWYEFSEIAKKSKDPLLQEEAFAVVNACKEVMKEISDLPALSYEQTLYLYGKSSALLRNADKVRYKFLLEGFLN